MWNQIGKLGFRRTACTSISTPMLEQRTDRTHRIHTYIRVNQLIFSNVALLDRTPCRFPRTLYVPAPERMSVGETVTIGKVPRDEDLETWESVGTESLNHESFLPPFFIFTLVLPLDFLYPI